MQRFIPSRRVLISLAVLVFLLAASFTTSALMHRASAADSYVSLNGSYTAAAPGDHLRGHHVGGQITVSLLLQPHNERQLNSLLRNLYDPSSPLYHQWLAQGEFNARFAPRASQVAQVSDFLRQAGLQVIASPTPFLVQATGPTAQVEASFHTTIDDYTAANGQSFFQND